MLAGLRFVLALTVAVTHVSSYFHDFNGVTLFISDFGAKAAVVGFFLLSGYAIAASMQRSTVGYYRRRALRIYPIYIFAIVVTFGIEHALHGDLTVPQGQVLEPSGWVVYLGHFFFLQTFLFKPVAFDSPVWSLAIEVAYYVVAPLFLRLPRWTVLAVIAVSALSFALPRNESHGVVYFVFTHLNVLVFAWPWFMGFYLFHNRTLPAAIGLCALGTFLMYQNTYMNPEPYAVQTYLAWFALLMIAAKANLGRLWSPAARRVLNFLGDVSYPLYLMQIPIMLSAYAFWGIVNAQVLVTLCVLGSVATYFAIDVYAKRAVISLLPRGPLAIAPNLRNFQPDLTERLKTPL